MPQKLCQQEYIGFRKFSLFWCGTRPHHRGVSPFKTKHQTLQAYTVVECKLTKTQFKTPEAIMDMGPGI